MATEVAIAMEPDKGHTDSIPKAWADFIITEQANMSIHSDCHKNPADPAYDMGIPPATYDEVMNMELGLMAEMKVWELVEPLPGRKIIDNHWVFKFKTNNLKEGAKCKAHLVAQGFSQVPGIDFHQTYAPVAHQMSIKILIALATMLDWELDCFNAKCAFLRGKLKEDLYMKQPRGFEQYSPAGILLICHLLSSLYGLKQAVLDRYELLCTILFALGFCQCKVDFAVFIYNKGLSNGH